MPAPRPNQPHYVFHVPRKALRAGAIAFGAGLLLFVLVWWAGRDDSFYTAPPVEASAPLAEMEPLPQPLPAGDGASSMPEAGTPSEPRPRLVEAPPQPQPPSPIDEAVPPLSPADPGRDVQPGALSASDEQPVPLRGSTPPPRYPASALRQRQSGTVLVRVEVDISGRPAGLALVQRSGSRELDRAALEAVRDWRFQPALRDGQPVPGSLVIPIDFRLE